jgi:hypothetical protein
MGPICSSETSVDFQRTSLRYISGDITHQYAKFFSGDQSLKNECFGDLVSSPSGSMQIDIYPEDGGRVDLRNVGFYFNIDAVDRPRNRHWL